MIEANSYLLSPEEAKVFLESFPYFNKICRSLNRDVTIEDYQDSLLQKTNYLSDDWTLENYYLMVHSSIFSLGVAARDKVVIIDDNYVKEVAPCDAPQLYVTISKIFEDPDLLIDISVSKIFIIRHQVFGLNQLSESENLTFYPVKPQRLVEDLIEQHKIARESLYVLKIISKLYQ